MRYHWVLNRFVETKGAATNSTNCTNGSRMILVAFVKFVAVPSTIIELSLSFNLTSPKMVKHPTPLPS